MPCPWTICHYVPYVQIAITYNLHIQGVIALPAPVGIRVIWWFPYAYMGAFSSFVLLGLVLPLLFIVVPLIHFLFLWYTPTELVCNCSVVSSKSDQ